MSDLIAKESLIDLLCFFKALANETRLKMAALLAHESYSGEQLADLLSIKPATVSHHLSRLAAAGLVTSTSEGHIKFYKLHLDAVRATVAATDEAAADALPALLARMHAAFARATQLEWMFWDSAYRLEAWPV